jgi:hypothetical protein
MARQMTTYFAAGITEERNRGLTMALTTTPCCCLTNGTSHTVVAGGRLPAPSDRCGSFASAADRLTPAASSRRPHCEREAHDLHPRGGLRRGKPDHGAPGLRHAVKPVCVQLRPYPHPRRGGRTFGRSPGPLMKNAACRHACRRVDAMARTDLASAAYPSRFARKPSVPDGSHPWPFLPGRVAVRRVNGHCPSTRQTQ